MSSPKNFVSDMTDVTYVTCCPIKSLSAINFQCHYRTFPFSVEAPNQDQNSLGVYWKISRNSIAEGVKDI